MNVLSVLAAQDTRSSSEIRKEETGLLSRRSLNPKSVLRDFGDYKDTVDAGKGKTVSASITISYDIRENKSVPFFLQNGDDVGNVTVRLNRADPYNPRPDSVRIEYKINGETKVQNFRNEAGGGGRE